MKKTALNMALSTALMVSLGMGLTACSGDKEKVYAPDRVDEAAELARSNAPEAEVMEFPETAAAPEADEATDMDDAASEADPVDADASEDNSDDAADMDADADSDVAESTDAESADAAEATVAE
ncbi:hypothetical protein J3492_09225 [Psychrobacter sp. F1192]|uniref:Lipoprotein n=1 Tax=Psychrobacter coccoides TaxID=2818440 RepID=A0ABS3NQT1_9GAMM|nr:hypothetical protein [Psychrobacter coccoides]MBO1531390.1 hypothetical protein [Psychrobacter coccoides]